MRHLVFCLFLAGLTATHAATFSFELDANQPRVITLPWLCDDRDYQSPCSYTPQPMPAARVVERVVIQSLGPGALDLWSLEVNGRDLMRQKGLHDWMEGGGGNPLWSVYDRWRSLKSHGRGDGKESSDPWGIVNLWGRSLCNDDAWAFAELMARKGVSSRRLSMNQHEVNEYWVNHSWVVLDTDQDAFFLKLDGITPASLHDVEEDPFLILRTKPFGRNSEWNPAAAWWNLALYDLVSRPLLPLSSKQSAVLQREPYSLFPGERAEFCYSESASPLESSSVSLFYDWANRQSLDIGFSTPYPPKEASSENREDLAFHTEGNIHHGEEESLQKICCDASVNSFPEFHAGENEVILRTLQGNGCARVTIEYSEKASQRNPPPAPVLRVLSTKLGTPEIILNTTNASRVWWQISPDPTFEMVPPNLDKMEEGDLARLEISNPLEQTFFVPQKLYYARARYSLQGQWSGWSSPLVFSVSKPDAPSDVSAEALTKEDIAMLRWKSCGGTMMIYGSDRADFLPEAYLGQQAAMGILKGGGLSIQWASDHNTLAKVSAQDGSAKVPLRRFYRLIRSENEILSIPSSLVRVHGDLGFAVLPATIFQRDKAHGQEGDVVAKPVNFP